MKPVTVCVQCVNTYWMVFKLLNLVYKVFQTSNMCSLPQSNKLLKDASWDLHEFGISCCNYSYHTGSYLHRLVCCKWLPWLAERCRYIRCRPLLCRVMFFTYISNVCFALLPPARNGVCFMQVLAVWYDRPALPAGVAGKRRSTITVITHQRDFSQTSGRSNATDSCVYPSHVAYLVFSKNKSQTGGMESQ